MNRLSILILALGVFATACMSVEEGESTGTGVVDETTTTEASEDTTTTIAQATTTVAEEPTTTAGAPSGGIDDCVVGTWVLDNELFIANFDAIFAEAGMPDAEISALDGTFTAELGSDGSLTGTRDGWGFAIGTADGDVVMEINGTDTGTWSTDGSTFFTEIDESGVEITTSVEVDGQTIELPDGGQLPVEPPEGIASNSEYTCSGDTLSLTNSGVESIMTRS